MEFISVLAWQTTYFYIKKGFNSGQTEKVCDHELEIWAQKPSLASNSVILNIHGDIWIPDHFRPLAYSEHWYTGRCAAVWL